MHDVFQKRFFPRRRKGKAETKASSSIDLRLSTLKLGGQCYGFVSFSENGFSTYLWRICRVIVEQHFSWNEKIGTCMVN
jgi:hypothetical protein